MVAPFISTTPRPNVSGSQPSNAWSPVLNSALATLRQLAGATEHEFLQIGSQMQGIYQRSVTLSQTTLQLLDIASGDRLYMLINRLREILDEMSKYLIEAQTQNTNTGSTLHNVGELLKEVGEPLTGVRKMCKHLYILEVSIKIESACLGEMGSEFINLAMDIKKLSQQTKEKVNAIQNHRTELGLIITKNSSNIENAKDTQDANAELTLNNAAQSLSDLEVTSAQFSQLGSKISTISEDSSNNISTIIQSMQFHDIYRQQVEHVIEGLEGVLPLLTMGQDTSALVDNNDFAQAISKTGDVCELQEAQLQFASTELYTAVTSIVGSLHAISETQERLAYDIITQTGGQKDKKTNRVSRDSFIADVSRQMATITSLLATCSHNNNEMATIMRNVTGTVRQITDYVFDIEEIGHDIIQIALNARIKAASTGQTGASLSVLAEEIGHMSNEAVQRTNLITTTLTEIHAATDSLSTESDDNQERLSAKLKNIEQELNDILGTLDQMGDELSTILDQVAKQVKALSTEIKKITKGIDVHERTKTLADGVLKQLQTIFSEARQLQPASAEFKEDLRLMAHRYTMESERRIHEKIAHKHGIGPSPQKRQSVPEEPVAESEFGDNVDLF